MDTGGLDDVYGLVPMDTASLQGSRQNSVIQNGLRCEDGARSAKNNLAVSSNEYRVCV
jgi:hypothetical protein